MTTLNLTEKCMRDRLIELLNNIQYCGTAVDSTKLCVTNSDIADYLLADGWIRLPYKVGDTVYIITENYGGISIYKGIVDQVTFYHNKGPRFWVYGHPSSFTNDDFGKTVFPTREEAERALRKEDESNGNLV